MGDYDDFASGSERSSIKKIDLHGQSREKLDRMVMRDIVSFSKEISHMKGRLLGLLEGNHRWDFLDGRTSTQVLCELMDCKYLGDLAFVLVSGPARGGNTVGAIEILASHGKGGGKLIGSTFNKIQDMNRIVPQVDIYLMGHDHQLGAVPASIIEFEGLVMKQKRQWYGRTGSFLRGYEIDEPSYVVDSLYRPSSLGTLRFDIKFERIRKSGADKMVKKINCLS
jgi:hypothetical protein